MPFLCGAHCFKRPWALTGCLHNSEEGPILSSHRQGEAGPAREPPVRGHTECAQGSQGWDLVFWSPIPYS